MAEVDFTIGHKEYRLAAQDGEERLLQRAAALLDAEASTSWRRRAARPSRACCCSPG